MASETEYAKAEAFRRYIKARRMQNFHGKVNCDKAVQHIMQRLRDERVAGFEALYPDFKQAYEEQKNGKA